MHYNKLTPRQAELLAVLAEECGEVIQAVGKILRHGLDSHYDNGLDNREQLHKELGDVAAVQELLMDVGELDVRMIHEAKVDKLARIQKYLHHFAEERDNP